MINTNEQRSKIILLYEKLLETFEMEQLEIAEHNLTGIERCFSLKKSLISELDALSNGKPQSFQHESSGSILNEQRAEIESLIKKIAVINEANAKAVLELKNKVADEMSAIQKNKKAFTAYQAYV